MITDLGRDILNALRKVLVQETQESERKAYSIIQVQSDASAFDV